MKVLSDSDPANYVAAINVAGAFAYKVEPQRCRKIADAVADETTARAETIIAELNAGDLAT
jgi:hypothetical protein